MTTRVRDQLVPIRRSGLAYTTGIAATPTVRTEEFGDVCAFLRGTPGKRVSCRIYGTRPEVCRTFEPGSRWCRDARGDLVEIVKGNGQP